MHCFFVSDDRGYYLPTVFGVYPASSLKIIIPGPQLAGNSFKPLGCKVPTSTNLTGFGNWSLTSLSLPSHPLLWCEGFSHFSAVIDEYHFLGCSPNVILCEL